jgi:hypothetical protein
MAQDDDVEPDVGIAAPPMAIVPSSRSPAPSRRATR